MKIHVTYLAQLRAQRGRENDTLELDDGATVRGVIDHLADLHGAKLREMLLTGQGRVRPSILIFADKDQIDPESHEPLADGQTLTLLSPMAGG